MLFLMQNTTSQDFPTPRKSLLIGSRVGSVLVQIRGGSANLVKHSGKRTVHSDDKVTRHGPSTFHMMLARSRYTEVNRKQTTYPSTVWLKVSL